ncbi:TPA: DUF3379 family protein [Vibrio harveyi]|uniref:DUF3379 family protein n=1 Tax=Vibrio harveyi TaxID=669 RepID=UPI003909C85D
MKTLKEHFAQKNTIIVLSVAFLTGLFISQIEWKNVLVRNANASLADIAMKRVTRDHDFVKNIKENVSLDEINAKLSPFNYEFSKNIPYDVRYLNHCGFGGEDALYLILQGQNGNISVFLTNVTSTDPSYSNKVNYSTLTMPVGKSSIILVGGLEEDLKTVANTLTTIVDPIKQ